MIQGTAADHTAANDDDPFVFITHMIPFFFYCTHWYYSACFGDLFNVRTGHLGAEFLKLLHSMLFEFLHQK